MSDQRWFGSASIPGKAKAAFGAQRLPVRLLNRGASLLFDDARRLIPIEPETLVARAERRTGLSDWGSYAFRPALEVLTDSLNQDSGLSGTGRIIARRYLDRCLSNRLLIENELKANPAIVRVALHRPVFITGLPRTGTTLLQRLLACDPAARILPGWEMMRPVPPRPPVAPRDLRVKNATRDLNFFNWAIPGFSVIHEIAAEQPDECVGLLQNTFATTSFEAVAPLPRYRQWLRNQDSRPSYRDFKRQLQILQWYDERHHWILKTPFHLVELGTLLDIFPDAAIIYSHREPGTAIPSFCSLLQTIYQLSCKAPDAKALGPSVLDLFAVATDAALAIRQKTGPDRFFDLSYRDLLANPLEQIARIYEWRQFPLSAEAKRQMTAWLQRNPQNAKGIHLYQPGSFGLERTAIEGRFAAYRDSYARFL